MNNTYLIHHGVKGQKWGVRHYQNTDGSYKPGAEGRYDPEPSGGHASKPKTTKEQRKQNVKKAAMAVGAAAAVGGTAYAVKKHRNYSVDKVIKTTKAMQNISINERDMTRAMYVSTNKRDNLKYRGALGKQLKTQVEQQERMQSIYGSLYQTHPNALKINNHTLTAKSEIKVASQKNASKVFNELWEKDAEFRNAVMDTSSKSTALNPLLNRKIDKNTSITKKPSYDAFNYILVDHSENGQKASEKFYSEMKKRGYDAIEDLNDKKYSGYNSKSATIIFNTEKLQLQNTSEMGRDYIEKQAKKANIAIAIDQLKPAGALYAGMYGAVGVSAATQKYIEEGA